VLDFANCVYEHHAFKEKVHELAFVKTSLTGIAVDALAGICVVHARSFN
jgi:hypothetical protein